MAQIPVADPNHVPETFIGGPFNIRITGELMLITFTVTRPNTSQLFESDQQADVEAVVVARLLLPTEAAEHVARGIARALAASREQSAPPLSH
jgi:hypothetical protein